MTLFTKLSSLCVLVAVALFAIPSTAQNPATYGSAGGRYGLTAWAINNQRVASQFNYDIDSIFGGNSVAAGAYTFPISTCTQALPLGGNKNVNPFSTNASVRINDISSSLSETVNGVTPTYSGGLCTLALTTVNTHTSFHLRSGTCGLQEAINDLGGNGGEVIVDQKFYDDGCTQSTITGINPLVTSTSGPVRSNVYVHDISNAQDTWYTIKPTVLTLISPAAAPTTGTVAGGTFTNGNVLISVTYVDALGGETLASTESTQATGGTTNGLTVTSPAAATGAVGYRVYMTAVGGSTLTGVLHTTASNCTQTTLESILTPTCAIGASTTVLAPITSTAKIPIESTAHSAFAFQPVGGVPNFAQSGVGTPQTSFGPFAAIATISSAANSDVAEFTVPAGALNYLGKTIEVCFRANYSVTSTGIPTWRLFATNTYGQSPVTLASIIEITQAAAVTGVGCFTVQTAAVGASGTFWSTGSMVQTLNSSGAGTAATDAGTAVSSALDLTKPLYFSLNVSATTASVTALTVNQLTIRAVNGN